MLDQSPWLGSFRRLCVLAFLLSTQPAYGTAGVLIVTHDFVVLAADSALKHTNSKGETTHFTQSCKIFQEGNIFYFPVGEYSYHHLGFDLISISKNAITKAGKIKNIYASIEPPVLERLPAIVQLNKRISPDVYLRWLKGQKIISIVFASFEDDAPTAIVVEFGIDPQGNIAPPTERTMISFPGQLQMVLFVSNEVGAATNSDSWNRRFLSDPINASREAIQLAIDESTSQKNYEVGPPISILRITKDSSGMVPGYEGKCGASRTRGGMPPGAGVEELMAEQEKDSRPFAEMMLEEFMDNPKCVAIDLRGMAAMIPNYIDFLRGRSDKFRAALFFAEEHIKSGKPWNQECESVIGEALRPKPPKRHGGA